MLKSKLYAELLEKFINTTAQDYNCDVKFKIYIHLDFSLSINLFIEFSDKAREVFPIDEEEESLQREFKEFVIDYYKDLDNRGKEKYTDSQIFIPEVRFEVEKRERADSPLNQKLLSGNRIEYGAKYRLSSLIDSPIKRNDNPQWGNVPIITFYSYKGGMGRTTTLMAYALYLAAKGKRVAVVDCDLEAPGYLNFFNLSSQIDLMKGYRNGLVEYLSDFAFVEYTDQYLDLANYVIIPAAISQGGIEREYVRNIFVVPGGNLNDVNEDMSMEREDKERLKKSGQDYMEGLSRINLSNPFLMRDAMGSLFTKLKKDYEIDVILVDSRTGFNDIFGTIALSMSDHVVGFMGFSEQTIPGLRQLFRYYANENTNFRLDLVTSLVPRDIDGLWIENGMTKISAIWQAESSDCDKNAPGHYLLQRLSILERIGTRDDTADARLVTLIEDIIDDERRKDAALEIGQMGSLFEHLTEEAKLNEDIKELSGSPNSRTDISRYNSGDHSSSEDQTEKSSFRLQKDILNYTKRKFADIHVFAEETDIKPSMFFYRKCMAQFFDPKKFIILGSKGSGKSMLYRALGTPEYGDTSEFILACSKKTVEKENYNFEIPNSSEIICINTISLKKELDLNELFDALESSKIKKFWMIYTWNVIMTDSRMVESPDFRNKVLEVSPISSELVPPELESYDKLSKFQELVKKDFNFFGNIEKDFRQINSYLKEKGKRLFLLYDGLDNINPRTWSTNISPLVDFWRDKTEKYSHITPKLFIRTDLFTYIEGTNTLRLKETTINIDWSLEEVFGYFFKIVLSDENIKSLFWIIFEKLDKDQHIKTVQNSWDKEAEQLLNPTQGVLGPLVKIYFGEKVEEAHIDTWPFFKDSLSNANGGISLRPFINLLNKDVIEGAIQDTERHVKAILPSKYYATQENRDNAANENFKDLAKGDDFTADILKFREYLKSSKGEKYRFKELDEIEFENLLSEIFQEFGTKELISNSIVDLRNQLIAAGIVAEIPRRRKCYKFASMYNYVWGLRNAENWERGTINYGRNGHFVVLTQDGRRISFQPQNEPKNANVGDKIEYILVEKYTGNFKVDRWRPSSRRR